MVQATSTGSSSDRCLAGPRVPRRACAWWSDFIVSAKVRTLAAFYGTCVRFGAPCCMWAIVASARPSGWPEAGSAHGHVKGPAPRPCVAHLAPERAVIQVSLPVVVRVRAFWHLMCAWGAQRQAHHRGMNPDHFVLTKERRGGGGGVRPGRRRRAQTRSSRAVLCACLGEPTFTTVAGCAQARAC